MNIQLVRVIKSKYFDKIYKFICSYGLSGWNEIGDVYLMYTLVKSSKDKTIKPSKD